MPNSTIENTMIHWPALSGLSIAKITNEVGEDLDKGILGKADNVRVDFRVLAGSNGFSGFSESRVYLGTEEEMIDTVAWLASEEKNKAVHIYPSRAKDATNRSKTLEKHILETSIKVIENCPFILYQLALLNRVGKYRDEIWWEYRTKKEWHDADYTLPISEDDAISKEEIGIAFKQLETNVLEIKNYISKANAVNFYKKLLSGTEFTAPSFIRDKKITSDILLTLFLPLEAELTDKLSFLVQFPRGRVDFKHLAEVWNIIPNIDASNVPVTAKNEDNFQKQAEYYADALFSNAPEGIKVQETLQQSRDSQIVPPLEGLSNDSIQRQTENDSFKIISDDQPVSQNKVNQPTVSLDSFYKLDFSSRISAYPANKNNHKIVFALYNYLCSAADVPDLNEFKPLEGFPLTLTRHDELLLSDWLGILKEEEKQNIRAVSIKVEYMKAIYFFLLMLSDSDPKTEDADISAGKILNNNKIPPFLLFKEYLPLEDSRNNYDVFVNNLDRINEVHLLNSFKQSLSNTVLLDYQSTVGEYCIDFIKNNCKKEGSYAEKLKNRLDKSISDFKERML